MDCLEGQDKADQELSEELVERLAFWDQVGREVVEQLEEVQRDSQAGEDGEGGCGDNCGHDHGHEENDHEHTGDGCCPEEDNCCADEACEGCSEEGADDDEEEEDDFEQQDDFAIEYSGKPSFSLYAFLHLLLMSPEQFTTVSSELERCIDMLVAVKNLTITTAEDISKKGKGKVVVKKEELQSKVDLILLRMYSTRLMGYPEVKESPISSRAEYAKVLREEEFGILEKFNEFLH